MRKINYYVAISLDGYISGPDEDISGFVADGDGVSTYLADLQAFDTVIMGRKTYEFGFKFGLKPGQPAYPHMEHHIFSNSLKIDDLHEKVHIHKPDVDLIQELKKGEGTDIYLCGGGEFAGWLLEHELIDILKIKLNPLILGDGVPLFGNSQKMNQMRLVDSQKYNDGLHIITYHISY